MSTDSNCRDHTGDSGDYATVAPTLTDSRTTSVRILVAVSMAIISPGRGARRLFCVGLFRSRRVRTRRPDTTLTPCKMDGNSIERAPM